MSMDSTVQARAMSGAVSSQGEVMGHFCSALGTQRAGYSGPE